MPDPTSFVEVARMVVEGSTFLMVGGILYKAGGVVQQQADTVGRVAKVEAKQDVICAQQVEHGVMIAKHDAEITALREHDQRRL